MTEQACLTGCFIKEGASICNTPKIADGLTLLTQANILYGSEVISSLSKGQFDAYLSEPHTLQFEI